MQCMVSYFDSFISELVQALVLDDSQNKGFVFAMGDLNYRINMTPEDVSVLSFFYCSVWI